MPCRRLLCSSAKNRLIDDSELCSLSLEIFLRAHCLLKNFVDFFKFHSCTCNDINYDKIPLYGALDIVTEAMTSVYCRKVPKEEFQPFGSFRSVPGCVQCRNVQDMPENIIQKVDQMLKCLQNCCSIENIIAQVKDVLRSLEKSSSCTIQMSERFQNLSLCLKEIMKKLVCCGQPIEGLFYDNHMKVILHLVNDYIRNWAEKRSGSRPSLKSCRFCDSVISETTRQWGTFCCQNAQQYYTVWKEWSLQQSIASSCKPEMNEGESKFGRKQRDVTEQHPVTPCSSKTCQSERTMKYQQDKISRKRIDGVSRESVAFDSAIKHRGSSRRTEGRGDEGTDLTKSMLSDETRGGRRGERRGERNIQGAEEYPIGPDGRRKRDTSFSQRTGASSRASRAGVGKTGKIRRGGKLSSRDRLAKSDTGESGIPRSGKREKSDRSRSRKARRTGDDDEDDEGDRTDKKSRRGKGRTRHGDTSTEIGKTYDGDSEEDVTGKRRRKKSRKVNMEGGDADTGRSTKGKRRTTEDGKASKSRRKRRGSSSDEEDESDSESTKKHARVKISGRDSEDKSPRGSGKGSKKGRGASEGRRTSEGKGTSEGKRKKEGEGVDSDEMDDDYNKKGGSRSQKRKSKDGRYYDDDMGHRHPIEYQLSNQHFVKLGWTVLPVAKTIEKVVQYRARPAKPHLNWFKKQGYNGEVYYKDGSTVFLTFCRDGSGKVFYPNGKLAIEISKQKSKKYDMYTVFSPGGKDSVGIKRDSQIVALFDTMGNGSVFNEDGATRLSYNQIGGIWRDNPTGLPLTWMWDSEQKKSITKTVYMEKSATYLEQFLQPIKTPLRSSGSTKTFQSAASSRNKEKKDVKQKPVVVEHQEEEEEEEEEEAVESGYDFHKIYSKEGQHLQPRYLKLNDFISFRIVNRSNISLQFLAGRNNIRIQLGVILDRTKEVASYFETSSSKAAILRSRFDKSLSSQLQPEDSLYHLTKGIQIAKKSARERRFIINKYRPLWYAWKNVGTRCRPR